MRLENLLNILKRSVYFMIEEFLEGMYNLRKVKGCCLRLNIEK